MSDHADALARIRMARDTAARLRALAAVETDLDKREKMLAAAKRHDEGADAIEGGLP